MQLELGCGKLATGVASSFLEMGAYEALCLRPGATFRSRAARFAAANMDHLRCGYAVPRSIRRSFGTQHTRSNYGSRTRRQS